MHIYNSKFIENTNCSSNPHIRTYESLLETSAYLGLFHGPFDPAFDDDDDEVNDDYDDDEAFLCFDEV